MISDTNTLKLVIAGIPADINTFKNQEIVNLYIQHLICIAVIIASHEIPIELCIVDTSIEMAKCINVFVDTDKFNLQGANSPMVSHISSTEVYKAIKDNTAIFIFPNKTDPDKFITEIDQHTSTNLIFTTLFIVFPYLHSYSLPEYHQYAIHGIDAICPLSEYVKPKLIRDWQEFQENTFSYLSSSMELKFKHPEIEDLK